MFLDGDIGCLIVLPLSRICIVNKHYFYNKIQVTKKNLKTLYAFKNLYILHHSYLKHIPLLPILVYFLILTFVGMYELVFCI